MIAFTYISSWAWAFWIAVSIAVLILLYLFVTRLRASQQLSAYCFAPLQDGSIRLLRLMPNPDINATIQCQLINYPLPDSGDWTHLYDALSYVWGSEEKPRSIFIDKGYLCVTENLYAALLRLRDRSLSRYIWIDAICINQDDVGERSRQVQLMAKIYARASRVIVWLEEGSQADEEAGSKIALNVISMAAEDRYRHTKPSNSDQQAVLGLLERRWFRRIWVLQEVAEARQVLIMCRSTEMDGSAFCLGLKELNLFSKEQSTQNRIRSAAYLIGRAVLRPRYKTSHSNRPSLHIRPLGELVDTYHNREATDPRDKVYALLGMSSEVPDKLSPDYTKSWKDLFHDLVESLIGKQEFVETWDEEEIAIIKSKGCVLGKVSHVLNGNSWEDKQIVNVIIKNEYGSLTKWNGDWTLQASAKPILKDDIVCLLQGASEDTIIRPYEYFYAVIAISVTPTNDKRPKREVLSGLKSLQRIKIFPHRFLLVWDWKKSFTEERRDYKSFLHSALPEHSKIQWRNHNAPILGRIGQILRYLEKYNEAITCLQKAINAYEWKYRGKHIKMPVTGNQQNVEKAKRLGVMVDILGRTGDYNEITEDGIIWIARSFDEEVIALLLDRQGDKITITKEVVKAAAGNKKNGREVMALLLDQREDQITITKRAVAVIAEKFNEKVMTLLLDQQGDQITITEEVVKAAAGNERNGKEVMALLFDQQGDKITITERAVSVAEKAIGVA